MFTTAEKLQSLKEQRSAKIEQMQNLHNVAESENRSFNETEQSDWEKLDKEVRKMDKDVETLERQIELNAKMAEKNHEARQKNEGKKIVKEYSIARAIRMSLGIDKREGLEEEMHQEAKREAAATGQSISGFGIPQMILKRAMSVGDDAGAKGGQLVATEKMGFMEALQNRLVLTELGANFMTGLVGNVDLPKGTAFTATWEGETDENALTDSTVTSTSLSAKRLAATALISKQLINQSSYSVETFINTQLQKAVAQALQTAAINGASGGNNPVGILNTAGIGAVALGTNGAAPTWADMIKLEKEIDIDNALMGKLAYVTNAKAKAVLKQAKADAGSGLFAWMNNEVNGYSALSTNSVPSTLVKGSSGAVCSAIILGNWEDLYIGQWGGLDIISDPYTKARDGQIQITVNSFWDVALPRPESFAAIKDALTS